MIPFDVHTHTLSPNSVYSLSLEEVLTGSPPRSMFSVGLHPWWIERLESRPKPGSDKETVFKDFMKRCAFLAKDQNCVAIGEIGLDRSINTPIEIQIEYFKAMVKMAKEHAHGIIVHSVRASDLLLSLKKDLSKLKFLIVHDFNGNQQIIDQFLEFPNLYFSLGKIFDRSSANILALRKIPLDRIFLETDSSDIDITLRYQQASQVFGRDLNEVQVTIATNVKKLF